MENTSLTLMASLRESENVDAWQRLFSVYQPLIVDWLKKYHVQSADIDDLAQEILMAVCKSFPDFQHNGRGGAFRAWLKSILINRLRNFWRVRDRRPLAFGSSSVDERLLQLEDPESHLSKLWNQEHDLHVLKQLLELIQPQFSADTWEAFVRVAIRGESAQSVSTAMGITLNAVFIAKSRVLRRLREEAAGWIESSSKNFLSM